MNYLETSKAKVVLLENINKNAVNYFKSRGFQDIILLKNSPDENELKEILKTVNIIGIRSRTKISNELLKNANNLMAIGCFCIGSDTVDKEFAESIGIPVFNAPFSNTRSVAELVIGEIICLLRKIPEKNKKCHIGEWDKNSKECFETRGKTLGIIGYGHIGCQVGILAEALNMNVIYYDIEKKLSLGLAKPVNTMEELLKTSDIVTLHVPNLPTTVNLIDKKEFDLMKDNLIFLNLSRGKVVNIEELVKNLKSKKIAGAGIDVYPKEPVGKDEKFVSELQEFDNVILTPHIGGSTEEAQENIAFDVSEKLSNFFMYGNTNDALNFPQINSIKNSGYTRIIHIHKNLPGVMKGINEIFGNLNINIVSQYLQTDRKLGYVAMDIKQEELNNDIFNKLKNVNHTIKVNIINME